MGGAAILMATLAAGCSGGEAAPTNVKGSQYIDTGNTAADQIGRDRAAAHRPRLPGKGVQPQ